MRNDQVGLTDVVFSWTLHHITDDRLYQGQVKSIPDTFGSAGEYLRSFIYPLLEETRASLCSSLETISTLPFAQLTSFTKCTRDAGNFFDAKVDAWRNESSGYDNPYATSPGDVFILANGKPETVQDLQRSGWRWTFAEVVGVIQGIDDGDEDDNAADTTCKSFRVRVASGDECRIWKSVFAVYVMNLTTNKRIMSALLMSRNLDMIKEVSSMGGAVRFKSSRSLNVERSLLDDMNESQAEIANAILDRMVCPHRSFVELIWGPPGTGKTKITAMILFILLKMKKRTLVCAPTNVAIWELASRVVKLVKNAQGSLPCVSQMLIFGNKKRLKMDDMEAEDIYLDYRVKRLVEFFALRTGWCHCFSALEDILVECNSLYQMFLDCQNDNEVHGRPTSFLEFFKERFVAVVEPVKRCLVILNDHVPASYVSEEIAQAAMSLLILFDAFQTMLYEEDLDSMKVVLAFSLAIANAPLSGNASAVDPLLYHLCLKRWECISCLRALIRSLSELNLPQFTCSESIAEFCYQKASLLFCTCSSSFRLYNKVMDPFEVLVIDEAAQLKECESVIPFQLPGIRHAILVGDERQLPAMVESKTSSSAGFGRSLFERLSVLGHPKHLLDTQYRMHPEISLFPTKHFYQNQILDASLVSGKTYRKCYLPDPMFGHFSFINVPDGREETGEGGLSYKNGVEVAAVLTILRALHKVRCKSGEEVNIGVISPYAAQVAAIKQKLGKTYENTTGFVVKVKTVDGFQGGEEDIIIISCVRSNVRGSIGFLADPRRTNVALTRARYCLWILGNERTLMRSNSVWEEVVHNAKVRQCFFDVDSNKKLYKAIVDVKKENDQLDDLLSGDSVLFRSARWKVSFSDNFLASFRKLTSLRTKASLLNFLLRIASGWRPKKINVDITCQRSTHVVQKYKVENYYVLCSIDIIKEVRYTQCLKVWDVLPSELVAGAVKRLDSIFAAYAEDFIRHCRQKCLEGDLEVPRSWDFPYGLIRERRLDVQAESPLDSNVPEDKLYVENTRVSESLLLMKFYSLTQDAASCLLSSNGDGELSLPFELTMQEQEIVDFPQSSFILGRSGTGKTTILTMKLFLREKRFREARYGSFASHNSTEIDVGLSPEEKTRDVLHQLFVTVSPKLCFAIKKHVSQLQSFALGGKFQTESSSVNNDLDDVALFKGIPDNFRDVSPDSYPLVITFHKFLMMLDGTVGESYFNRFPDLRELLCGKYAISSTFGLHSHIKAKEVTYDKFHAIYWPRFNNTLTRKLDPSRVFTEIISHIKAGARSGDSYVGIISKDAYVSLSRSRVSTLNAEKRADLYDIFEEYEKLKKKNWEFDLADFVNDIHCRLHREAFKGDDIDFVYIDEVQDLTMSQLSLFKYICRNVEEGFVFSGDTAQTIARGIDFRFEDIRSLFYKDFLYKSGEMSDTRTEKGQLSKSFHLNQNFRTHDGIFKLAQSIVDLLYYYFPLAVDVLSPETSHICGEAPVILLSDNDDNAIVSIFGNSNKPDKAFVGFGAEQVILVRDDHARNQVWGVVGGRALVLTIVECKGLEFQDVLLFDFFGTSPLKSRWRVIYEFMKDKDLLHGCILGTCQSFDEEKHDILCSELKQLYVAVTRTRQRLWICESSNDMDKPFFDYWKRLCLVQARVVDSNLAEAMQVASTLEQWKAQGFKLLQEGNYPMAVLCFERSGYIYGEKLAKASSLKADADLKHTLSPQEALGLRRQAAEIFEAIGESRSAAECYHMIGEYKKAGTIYMEEHQYAQAGDCFRRGGFYALAADSYASGRVFSSCMLVCVEGMLFEVGLRHIESWRSQGLTSTQDMLKLVMDFLKMAAQHYHSRKDNKSMMTYVRAFDSFGDMREFLVSMGCLDELICLDVEHGNFLEAASIARMKGDVLLEADLLGKGKFFKRASMLILGYVLSCSLWGNGSKGWPLKAFSQKEEMLQKARTLAQCESDAHFRYIDLESSILLLGKNPSFAQMQNYLRACKGCSNIAGEASCLRTILDVHICANALEFQLEDGLILEELISADWMSSETLFYYWSCWKDLVVKIIQLFRSSESQELAEDERRYWQFCLDYLGVREEHKIMQTRYSLLHKNADWCRNIENNCSRASMASAAEIYWRGQLMSVGMEVLEKLNKVYQLMIRSPTSNFYRCRGLIRIYEAASFLLEANFLSPSFHERKTLQNYFEASSKSFFDSVFLNRWQPSTKDMISLRETESSTILLARNFIDNGRLKYRMSSGQMGRIAMFILGSGRLHEEFAEVIGKHVGADSACEALIRHLIENFVVRPTCLLTSKLCQALEETYKIDWRNERDYMNPTCFMYLIERLLILTCSAEGHFFAAKSSLVEFLICHHGEFDVSPIPEDLLARCLQFILRVSLGLLSDMHSLQEWIKRSNLNLKEYYWQFMRKLVLLVCNLLLNFGDNPIVRFHLHDFELMSRKLALELGSVLLQFLSKSSRKAKADILAGEMQKIGDTLVLVSSHYDCSGLVCPNSIFLDTRVNKTKEDMVQVLFPNFPVHKPTEDVAEVQEHPVVAKGGVVHEEESVEEKCEEEEVAVPPAEKGGKKGKQKKIKGGGSRKKGGRRR
ncbi:hypothetical protein MLD38_005211 [Melastoma candidum]|uniref:Uncharacterized protein n=1 Tax=Melastoma candidum TaxID=119954 RepID=A0ACB9S7V7_9MYRT|nr:hypothetical protein MLD38_005211 [Melastoma candidum]